MARADGTVLPNPAIPKTLGILNVLFAVALTLFGVCGAVLFVAAPAIQRTIAAQAAQRKVEDDRQRAADLKVLDDRAAAATTDEARATIARERAELLGRKSVAPPPVDLSAIRDDPGTIRVILLSTGWSVLLNVVLLASGVGLIRLRNWGRRSCLAWAALSIATVLAWAVYHQVFDAEATRAAIADQLAKFRAAAQQPGAGPPEQLALRLFEMIQQYGIAVALSGILAQISYPILCLILLSTPRARAACLPAAAGGDPEATGGPALPPAS